MNTIVTTLTTEAIFSDDGVKRYLLRKTWDEKKPKLMVVMRSPSVASGIELDSSTLLVLCNCWRLGYGSVDILNLFATINDFSLKHAESEDSENLDAIIKSAETADTIVYAAGVGKAKSKSFQERQKQVLTELLPFESKLNCLCSENGKARLQHPLSPAVRTWYLSSLEVGELIEDVKATEPSQKKAKNK